MLRAQLTPSPYPVHLRLARDGQRFHGSYSVGVLSCAHNQDRLGLTVFENLSVAP